MSVHAVAKMASLTSSRSSGGTVSATMTTTRTAAKAAPGVAISGRKTNTDKCLTTAPRRVAAHQRGGGGGGGGGRVLTMTSVAVEARLSGFSGPRVSGTQRPGVSLVGSVLRACTPGDLMALTLTPGDGEGRLASGENIAEDVWFVVTKLSTSSGGRHMVEGEIFGLKVQIIDQPSGGARLGITGVVVNQSVPWLSKFPGWEQHLIKQAHVEPLLKSSVVGAKIVSSLSTLETCVAAHPAHWTSGEVSAKRRAVITDPIERATQCAGELTALLSGQRNVVMCQLWAGWLDPGQQPAGAPWVSQLLQRAAESQDIGIEMSVSDDVEGNPGITAVLYRKKPMGEAAPAAAANADANADAAADKKKAVSSGVKAAVTTGAGAGEEEEEMDLNALAAKTIATFGAQADCPAVTPYERVLVGMALGYDERDIAYHLDQLGSPFSAALFMRAREVLKK